jgi:hypothetical protein
VAVTGADVAVGSAVASGVGDDGGLVGVDSGVAWSAGSVATISIVDTLSIVGTDGVGSGVVVPRPRKSGRTAKIPKKIKPIMSENAARIQYTWLVRFASTCPTLYAWR